MNGSDLSRWAANHLVNVILAIVVVSIIIGATIAGLTIRACTPAPTIVQEPSGIDAGPGEAVIAGRLDAAVQADEQAIRDIEDRNQRAVAQFDDDQAAEYAQVRRQGRHAVAAWLSDFNSAMKTDAGTP